MHDEQPDDGPRRLARHLDAESDTLALGERVARGIRAGTIVYLRGELGAGKTTFARGLLRGLGHQGRVKSPTYTLAELYNVSKLCLYHFDFYRIEDPREWLDAGFRECFGGECVCLVEWPEKAGASLPQADLEVALRVAGEGRDVVLEARTEAGRECLEGLIDR